MYRERTHAHVPLLYPACSSLSSSLPLICQEYTGECWCWDIVDIYRRMTMISWLPFFGGNSGALRAGIGTCLSVLSLILFREAQPFQSGSTNVLAVTAQYQIMVSEGLPTRIPPARYPATLPPTDPPTSQIQVHIRWCHDHRAEEV